MTTKLHPFVFPDSGKRISIRKVSPFLADEIRKAYPPPKPPVQTVVIDGVERAEANPAHPDYLRALAEYNAEFGRRVQSIMIKRGVVVELGDGDKAEVAELRADMAEEGVTLRGSDEDVYLWHICISTPQDLTDLATAIVQRSQPTEGSIAAALDNFRG